MPVSRRSVLAGAGAAAASPWVAAQVQLPETMRVLVPFPAGGALDSMARIFAESYRATTGRHCVVENKPGASTTIAASEVSRGKPDGSIVLWTTGGHTTNAVLMPKLPYDPIEDFTPLTIVYTTDGFAMLTRANSPLNSVQDVIDAAKKSPGKISYGSAGTGNTTHVVGALFARAAGIDLLHVPYKGTPLTDLISGVVDLAFIAPSSVMQYIQANRMKALGISGQKRAPTLPNVPTFVELGMKEVDIPAWIGLLAPPKMPSNVLSALYASVMKALRDPGFIGRMKEAGNEVSGQPPREFAAYVRSEIERYRRVLPPLGIAMDV